MSQRIKILFLHRTLRQSGASRQIYLLFKSLDRAVFDPYFAVQVSKHLFFHGDNSGLYVLNNNELNLAGAVRELARVIRAQRPTIIQSFNTDGNLLAYMATRRSPVPVFMASLRNTNKSWLEMLVEQYTSHAYTKLIVNSTATQQEISRRLAVARDRVEVIHNGVDTGLFKPYSSVLRHAFRSRHHLPQDAFIIVSVGRIAPQKNHECTARALALLRERRGSKIPFVWICLGLIEDRIYYKRVKRLVSRLKLDGDCRFIESVVDIPVFYNMADVSVLSSNWEGMPNALLESMACERLAIVSEAADNDSIVRHEVNGLLFPKDDSTMLAARLSAVMGMDPRVKRRWEARARSDVIEYYGLPAMVKSYQNLYLKHVTAAQSLEALQGMHHPAADFSSRENPG